MENLYQLLTQRRQQLIDRWINQVKAALTGNGPQRTELTDHVPHFIDELSRALHPSALPLPDVSASARDHGVQRLRLGFDVGQVVREYGMLFDCILELARAQGGAPSPEEIELLSRAINRGTAEAVSQYSLQRDAELKRQAAEHLGFVAHELRNPLLTARLAFDLLRKHELREGGRAAAALHRGLTRVSDLIDGVLTESWLRAGAELRVEPVNLRQLVDELAEECAVELDDRGLRLLIAVEPSLVLGADRRILHSALSNLVRNAIKFSRSGGTVFVRARAGDGRMVLEIEDACGGLPPGKSEELFTPFVQDGGKGNGFGLGLAIARQAAEAHQGTLRLRNLPKKGCVLVMELPTRP